jgi:hypothetical protein
MEENIQQITSGQSHDNQSASLIEIESKKLDLEMKKMEFWTKIVGDNLPRVLEYFQQKMLRHDVPVMKTGIWILSAIVTLIVAGSGTLVYYGKLDSSTFAFVIGTVLGYLLSFSRVFLNRERE